MKHKTAKTNKQRIDQIRREICRQADEQNISYAQAKKNYYKLVEQTTKPS